MKAEKELCNCATAYTKENSNIIYSLLKNPLKYLNPDIKQFFYEKLTAEFPGPQAFQK